MSNRERVFTYILLGLLIASVGGCFGTRRGQGGGQTEFTPPRKVNPADIALPDGYRIEPITTEWLTFPTGVTFDNEGRVYVTESGYSYGEVWATPRLLRVETDGRLTEIAIGGRNGPWTGVFFHDGNFFVAEGGQLDGGKVLKISRDGKITPLVENLPSKGDHHTNGPVVGADHMVYFGQGVATNSGVVGTDNAQFGWLHRARDFHDIPCQDVTLRGQNFETTSPFAKQKVKTGAFLPYGVPSAAGQVITGGLPCSGAIMRCDVNGGGLELIAWGFRNPFGMTFGPDNRLYVLDNGFDERGSRPIFGAGDYLWRIDERGQWFGWPDFAGGQPVNDRNHDPLKGPKPDFLLAEHPSRPPKPVAYLGVHSSSDGVDFSRSASFGHVGQAFVAQLGDQSPITGKSMGPVGFKVVRVNTETGEVEDFAVNKGKLNGPASKLKSGGLERPLALRFNPAGDALYVVDFGVMLERKNATIPQKNTGMVWRISRM